MANKITPVVLTSGFASIAPLNLNFNSIATELNDKVLYRDTAEPNQMEVNLDMNSQRIINLPAPENGSDAVRFSEIVDGVATTDTVMPSPMGNVGKVLGTDGSLFVFQKPIKSTIADITSLTKATLAANIVLSCAGRLNDADNSGGTFRWDSVSTTTPDGGVVFASDEGGTGRWIKINFLFLTPEMFGAIGDGATDDLAALTSWWTYSVQNHIKMIPRPVTYLFSASWYNSSSADNIDIECYGGVATFKLITNKVEQIVDMNEVGSVDMRNIVFDLNSLCAAAMDLRNSSVSLIKKEVMVENFEVKNAVQTTQVSTAAPLRFNGRWQKVEVNGYYIDGLVRTPDVLASQALVIEKIVGVVHIHNCTFKNIMTPDEMNADAIAIFGAENLNDTVLDTGVVLIENNYFEDVQGRFVKSQHSNTIIHNNSGKLSDDFRTITNWHFADFQTSNGIITNNRLDIGANILAIDLTSWSASFVFAQNNKDVPEQKSFICAGNIVTAQTKLALAVATNIRNGRTHININNNNFGLCSFLLKHTGADADFDEVDYQVNDNLCELKNGFMTFGSLETYTKLFFRATDNSNIDTIIGNFRPMFPSGALSLGSNFVIRNNTVIRDVVSWNIDANVMHDGCSFVTSLSINNAPPGSGTNAHWTTNGLQQTVMNSTGSLRFQRTGSTADIPVWGDWYKTILVLA